MSEAALAHKSSALEACEAELAGQRAIAAQLQSELESARSELETARSELEPARSELVALRQSLDSTQSAQAVSHGDAEGGGSGAEAEAEARMGLAALRAEADALRSERDACTREMDALRGERDACTRRRDELLEEQALLLAEADRAAAALEAAVRRAEAAEQELAQQADGGKGAFGVVKSGALPVMEDDDLAQELADEIAALKMSHAKQMKQLQTELQALAAASAGGGDGGGGGTNGGAGGSA